MTSRNSPDEEEDTHLFTGYGELVLLLDASPAVLREAIRDCSPDQKLKIIGVLEDQLNETPIKGNEKLFKRHLYIWMFTIRQLDDGTADMADTDNFKLNFKDWEHQQFY